MKKLMEKILLVAAILILFANSIYAADLYLDNGASGCSNGSTNYDVSTRVCGSGSETVYVDLRTCSNNLGSADHLYIRAGSYYYNSAALNWYEGSLTIAGNGQIVENYNSEVVWIQTGTDHTDLTNGDLNNPIIIGGSNNTLKGNGYNLFVWGCIIGSGSSNTVEGIDISGGWDHQSAIGGDAWYDMFRIMVSSNFLIKDSKIHDNYNHGTSTHSTPVEVDNLYDDYGTEGIDDHNASSLLILPSGKLLVFYACHLESSTTSFKVIRSTNIEDISTWDAPIVLAHDAATYYNYPEPRQFSNG